jgi:hypothetical protein
MFSYPETLVAIKGESLYESSQHRDLDLETAVKWRVIKNFKLTIAQAFAFAEGKRDFGCVRLLTVSDWESKKRGFFEQRDGSWLDI